MSKYCPLRDEPVVYLECIDCDVKNECKNGYLKKGNKSMEKTKIEVVVDCKEKFSKDVLSSLVYLDVIGDMIFLFIKENTEPLTVKEFMSMGISKEELFDIAINNTAKKHPSKIESIEGIVGSLLGVPLEDGETRCLVISNDSNYYGAVSFFYPGVIQNCTKRMGGSFYMLPSSIHEVIIAPVNTDSNMDSLSHMVRSINAECVSAEEQLSNRAYYYDAKSNFLR